MRLHPNTSEHWQALRLCLSCALAWGVATLVGLPEAYWALITTVVVTRPLLPQTLDRSKDRIVSTVIGGVLGFLVVWAASRGWPKIPLFCLAFVLTAFVVARVPAWNLAGITLIIMVLIPSNGSSLWRPVDRVAAIVIGILAAALVAFVTRPKYVRAVLPSIAPQDDKEQDDRLLGR